MFLLSIRQATQTPEAIEVLYTTSCILPSTNTTPRLETVQIGIGYINYTFLVEPVTFFTSHTTLGAKVGLEFME